MSDIDIDLLERRAYAAALEGFGKDRFIVELRVNKTEPQMLQSPGGGEATVLPLTEPVRYTCVGPAREVARDSGLFELRVPARTEVDGQVRDGVMLMYVHYRDILTLRAMSQVVTLEGVGGGALRPS